MVRSRATRFGSKSLTTSGTIYQRGGGNFEIRKHSIVRQVDVDPGKSVIIPLLHYHPTASKESTIAANPKIIAQGSKRHLNTAVQDGSRVENIKLEIQVQPKTLSSSAILDFYTGRIMTSFHDIKGEQIYGLEESTHGSLTGKTAFTDETGSHPSVTEVSDETGQDTAVIPMNAMNMTSYETGDVIKHWWRNNRKNVIYGGQPVLYSRWEKVPAKVKRSNPGMFYGMYFMNDTVPVSGSETDTLEIQIKESFTEIPLIQE